VPSIVRAWHAGSWTGVIDLDTAVRHRHDGDPVRRGDVIDEGDQRLAQPLLLPDRHRLVVDDQEDGARRFDHRVRRERRRRRRPAAAEPDVAVAHEFEGLDRPRAAVNAERDLRRLQVRDRRAVAAHDDEVHRRHLRLTLRPDRLLRGG
jgi:hypothetical protein